LVLYAFQSLLSTIFVAKNEYAQRGFYPFGISGSEELLDNAGVQGVVAVCGVIKTHLSLRELCRNAKLY
jgi:hypothetical protein